MTPKPLLFADIHHSGEREGARWSATSPRENVCDPTYYTEFATHLPCGGFDGALFSDFVDSDPVAGSPVRWPFEPTTLAAAVLSEVPDLNVVVTASTVLSTPDQLHDQFATLGALSQGRIGWNIATSGAPGTDSAAATPTPSEHERHRLADGVVTDLLLRWGEQRPLLVHAGTYPADQAFAARYADVVCGATPTKRAAKAFRRGLRQRAAAAGRDPDGIRFLPGILTTLGRTRDEASALRAELDSLGTDNTARPAHAIAGSRGHLSVTGTGPEVAAVMNDWVSDEACDGFVVKFAQSPSGAADFISDVTPLLHARGLGSPGGPFSDTTQPRAGAT